LGTSISLCLGFGDSNTEFIKIDTIEALGTWRNKYVLSQTNKRCNMCYPGCPMGGLQVGEEGVAARVWRRREEREVLREGGRHTKRGRGKG